MDKKQIIKKLIRIRESKSITQEQLADAIGRDVSYIKSIENGEINFGVLNIIRLCNGLNVNPIEFYCKEDL